MYFLKFIYRYISRVHNVFDKVFKILVYSLKFKNSRNLRDKYKEIVHSIDKANRVRNFDPKRIRKRFKELEYLLPHKPKEQYLQFSLNTYSDYNIDGIPTIRNYSKKKYSKKVLMEIIEIANKYPKSCARDASFVIRISANQARFYFSGMTCFSGIQNCDVLVVVVDQTAYDQKNEMFAPFIDASIFATAIVNEAWKLELGTCMLNWTGQSREKEKQLRKILNLKKNHLIIMGICIGSPEIIYHHSPKKPIDELYFEKSL